MFKLKRGYFYPAILLIISIGLTIASCGGGNTGIIPSSNANPNPSEIPNFTPIPILTNVSVSGYMYAGNITTEDGETIPSINVLDVPAYQADSSGNEPFITQFSNSLKQDYPEDWAKPEIQELYAQLNKTLSESKPLPEYNVGAQVYSVYDDSSAIPINSNGYFEDSVLKETTDNNVKLEVALGEDSYTEVETLPSSNILSSSEATNAELKSCPEKIFAFPGEIVIFRVTANGLNLKSAGLKFVLDNPSIGCVTQPVYLCFFGEKKHQTSYGCLYVKNGLNTPIDTTITAITNSGLSLKIFTEVLKKTGNISGTVFTGDIPLVKGKVKSLGPKACCKLDSAGNYTLPKVFLGHERSVVATWQTSENGQKVRHREEKIIDFFNSDLTGFNFGIKPTPTSTPTQIPTWLPPGDPYINDTMSKVWGQFVQWLGKYGEEQAREMTLKWLNGELKEPPRPENIIKAIGFNKGITLYFSNGMTMGFSATLDDPMGIQDLMIKASTPHHPQKEIKKDKEQLNKQEQEKVNTFNSARTLILAPLEFNYCSLFRSPGIKSFQWDIADNLMQKGYEVDAIRTSDNTLTINYPPPPNPNNQDPNHYIDIQQVPPGTGLWYLFHKGTNAKLTFNIKDPNNLVKPSDFINRNLKNYGIISIISHTDENSMHGRGIQCSPCETDNQDLIEWQLDNISNNCDVNLNGDGFWYTTYVLYKELNPQTGICDVYPYYVIFLLPKVFEKQDFNKDSLVFIDSCLSWDTYKDMFSNKPVKVFMGYQERVTAEISARHTYEFFSKLTGLDPNTVPVSFGKALNNLTNNPYPNDPQHATLAIYPDPNQLLETYFPTPVTITVEQAKEGKL